MKEGVHLLGIRHHGPGSARSVLQALEAIQPDVVLVEGPPDAQEVLQMAGEEGMNPPVALLIYRPDQVRDAVYYPFAVFSPEWQAIRFGAQHKIPVRFMDLPQSRRMAMREAKRAAEKESPVEGSTRDEPESSLPELSQDPLRYIAKAAGFEDSERWWEHQFETRYRDEDVFGAVLELMTELREEVDKEKPLDELEAAREAHMRQSLREAQKEGFQRIAVVLGAWHAPALASMPPAARDKELIQSLPKCKTAATWIPWTYGRLLFSSGYGAGIESPGYYGHLWENRHAPDFTVRWMARVAHLLRKEDLEGSTASVIESTRLAETLAALRGRAVPGLAEFHEASRAVFCFGDSGPLALLNRKLVVGEKLGAVPPTVPEMPIQSDLRQSQKRLRMAPEADERGLELDLRKDNDLERSRLLHRLKLLDIPWGKVERSRGKGTFRELWKLRWDPEFEIRLIDASPWGNSVQSAAEGKVLDFALKATALPDLAAVMQDIFLADLPQVIPQMVEQLKNLAAISSDIGQLMATLPPLAEVLRYGNVRQAEAPEMGVFIEGLVVRICIGLPAACAALGDEAAEEMMKNLNADHAALSNLQEAQLTAQWNEVLRRLANSGGIHGVVGGRCCRLLLDAGVLSPEEIGTRMKLMVGPGVAVSQTASWIEGFLTGSGLLLLHHVALWALIDRWIQQLSADVFQETLPLLRRTFATFPAGERRQMAELSKQAPGGTVSISSERPSNTDWDATRGDAVLPLLGRMLGLGVEENKSL